MVFKARQEAAKAFKAFGLELLKTSSLIIFASLFISFNLTQKSGAVAPYFQGTEG